MKKSLAFFISFFLLSGCHHNLKKSGSIPSDIPRVVSLKSYGKIKIKSPSSISSYQNIFIKGEKMRIEFLNLLGQPEYIFLFDGGRSKIIGNNSEEAEKTFYRYFPKEVSLQDVREAIKASTIKRPLAVFKDDAIEAPMGETLVYSARYSQFEETGAGKFPMKISVIEKNTEIVEILFKEILINADIPDTFFEIDENNAADKTLKP